MSFHRDEEPAEAFRAVRAGLAEVGAFHTPSTDSRLLALAGLIEWAARAFTTGEAVQRFAVEVEARRAELQAARGAPQADRCGHKGEALQRNTRDVCASGDITK
jgi:hypothetical protein